MSDTTIGPLARVTLVCGVQTLSAFIFGLGRDGLTPVEHLMAGRRSGEEVRLTFPPGERDRFFGHLAPVFHPVCAHPERAELTVRIAAVEPSDPREVVRALAATVGHGPCDCGCGGFHRRQP
jgi:hypothetical protein